MKSLRLDAHTDTQTLEKGDNEEKEGTDFALITQRERSFSVC